MANIYDRFGFDKDGYNREGLLWSSFFVTFVAK